MGWYNSEDPDGIQHKTEIFKKIDNKLVRTFCSGIDVYTPMEISFENENVLVANIVNGDKDYASNHTFFFNKSKKTFREVIVWGKDFEDIRRNTPFVTLGTYINPKY